MRSVTEEPFRQAQGPEPVEGQRRQTHAGALPVGLPMFDAAPALLVAYRSTKDMLAPRALSQQSQHQISSNAHVPFL